MQLAAEVFRRLDIAVVVKWNNRRFLGEILESAGVPAQEHLSVMLTLDKLAKIGIGGVLAELYDKGLTPRPYWRLPLCWNPATRVLRS